MQRSSRGSSIRHRIIGTAVAGLLVAGALVAGGPPAAGAPLAALGDRLYVTNSALQAEPKEANVGRFGIDAAGLVSPAGTVPAGQGARGIVFTPALSTVGQRYAYVSSQTVNAIGRYRVAGNGALTPLGSTGTPEPFGIATDPRGRAVYVGNFDDGTGHGALSAYRVEVNGDLTLLNRVLSGGENAKGVAITPDGRFAYVVHGTPNGTGPSLLTGFALGPDGSIGARVSQATVGSSGHRIVITPDGAFAYVTNQEAGDVGDIFGFKLGDDGSLSPVSGKPFEGGVWTEGAAISPDGRRLYITALGTVGPLGKPVQDGQVRGFDIGPGGQLTEIARLDFGFDPVDLAFGLDGTHIYVADFSADTVTVFAVDAAGHLTAVQTAPTQGRQPAYQSVVVQPRSFIIT